MAPLPEHLVGHEITFRKTVAESDTGSRGSLGTSRRTDGQPLSRRGRRAQGRLVRRLERVLANLGAAQDPNAAGDVDRRTSTPRFGRCCPATPWLTIPRCCRGNSRRTCLGSCGASGCGGRKAGSRFAGNTRSPRCAHRSCSVRNKAGMAFLLAPARSIPGYRCRCSP